MTRKLAVCAIVSLLVCACYRDESVDREAILVLPGAANVRSERGFGDQGSEYTLASTDAQSSIVQVSEHLRSRGWSPLTVAWDNPTQKTSYVDGWGCIMTREHPLVFQWLTDWRDEAGNVITYDFTTNEDVRTRHQVPLEVKVSIIGASHAATAKSIATASGEPKFTISDQCTHLLAPGTVLQPAKSK